MKIFKLKGNHTRYNLDLQEEIKNTRNGKYMGEREQEEGRGMERGKGKDREEGESGAGGREGEDRGEREKGRRRE